MDGRVAQAIATMERHLERPLRVAQLARRVNLSVSHYLRELRLDRARVLVEESTLSIKEIRAVVGINDPSHFARDFARRHGASPRKTRAGARSSGRRHFCLPEPLSSTFDLRTAETAHSRLDGGDVATSIL